MWIASGRLQAKALTQKKKTTSYLTKDSRLFPSLNLGGFFSVGSRGRYAQGLCSIDSDGGASCGLLLGSRCIVYFANRYRRGRRLGRRVLSAIIRRFCAVELLPDGAFSVQLIVLAAAVAGRPGPAATHLYAAKSRLAYRGVPADLHARRHDRNPHRLRVKTGA